MMKYFFFVSKSSNEFFFSRDNNGIEHRIQNKKKIYLYI